MFQKSIFLFLSLILVGLAQAQDLEQLSEKVDSFFTKYIPDDRPGGAAVVVIKDGKVLHKNTYGLADYENKVPISNSSVFDIASVSKQFLGYTVALLEQEGKLSLQDDVRKYIPELPDFGHTITIGHLLFHQSGLRDWPGTMKLAGVGFDDVLTFEQILSMAYQQEALNFVPGSRHLYSNTGYNVLVEAVQRITQQSFRAWTTEHIFQPLGMNNTFFRDQFDESVPNAVKCYYKEDDEVKLNINSLTALGSSSLQTTIDDFALWLQHIDSEEAKDIILKMQVPGKLTKAGPASYAYGFDIDTYGGLKRVYHTGSWASFRSFMGYFPDQHFSIAVFLNHDNWAEGFAREVIDLYLEDELQEGGEEAGYFDEEQPEIATDLDLDYSRYTGMYYLERYLVYLTITEEEGQLYVQATGEDTFPMEPVSATRFWVDAYDSSIYFNMDGAGNAESVTYHTSLCERRALPPSEDELDLTTYEGNYYSRELNTSYQVVLKEGQLYLSNLRNGQILLEQVCKDGFLNDTFYAPVVEFQRNDKGEIVSFAASQYRSRNQIFRRQSIAD